MSNVKEKIVIDELIKGSYMAFDNLFESYSDKLYHFVLSIIKVPQLAEDIVQEVFIKIWERRLELNRHKSFKSFLFSIAYNETISLLRRKKLETKYLEQVVGFIDENKTLNTPELELEYHEIQKTIQQVVETLPERRKQIYRLSREKGLSNNEIAEKLNISKNTVENQLVVALKTIREKIDTNQLLVLMFLHLFVL